HPNIIYISDFGLLPDGRPYLVMEFLEGPTLSQILRRAKSHRLDMVRACRIAAQIARGMQVVHDKKIVHRDLKPENIFVLAKSAGGGDRPAEKAGEEGEDFVKIVDFGIAKDTRAATALPDASMPAQRPQLSPEMARSAQDSEPSSQSLPEISGEVPSLN